MSDQAHTTELLLDYGAGGDTLDRLLPIVYGELRRMAHRHMRRERSSHTFSTTALVHEVYLRLVDQSRVEWTDRAHFLAIASRAMRRILIDYARRRKALKRGGNRRRVVFDDAAAAVEAEATELISLDDALTELTRRDERLGKVVECRFFGGMTVKETAAALDVSVRTVERDWTRAKAYLQRALNR